MKTILSLLILSVASSTYSQNLFNNLAIQEQNYLKNDNVVQNNDNIQSRNNSPRVQRVRPASNNNRGNRTNFSSQQVNKQNLNINSNPQADQLLIDLDNVSQVPIIKQEKNKQVSQENESPQINLNVSIDLPKIQLNRIKDKVETVEKTTPKRLEDYRIKTGSGNSTGSSSHKTTRKKHSFSKKVANPIKCWWNKNFKRGIKFKVSCECFKF